MAVPAWLIALCPLVGLLAVIMLAWWFVRRGIGAAHRAASFGDVEKLAAILTARPDALNQRDALGMTPLEYAACWGQLSAAKMLIDRGADVNRAKNASPLHLAAESGNKPLAAALLAAGANVDIRAKNDGTTPLHAATIKRRAAMVAFLIEHGAALDLSTKSDWTACHFAAHDGNVPIMRMLIEAGADWQAENADSKSPLQLALAGGHQGILDLVGQLTNIPQRHETN